MEENNSEEKGHELVVKFYKKYVEPFIAIFILVLLIVAVKGLIGYKTIQEEIKDNCGWEEEDYRCYCQKAEVLDIENSLKSLPSIPNISLQGLND